MGLFSDILGAVKGAGCISDAVTEVSKVVGQALGMAQRKEDRNEGAIAQQEATDDATLKTLENASAPISTTNADLLWNHNKAKYGIPDKPV